MHSNDSIPLDVVVYHSLHPVEYETALTASLLSCHVQLDSFLVCLLARLSHASAIYHDRVSCAERILYGQTRGQVFGCHAGTAIDSGTGRSARSAAISSSRSEEAGEEEQPDDDHAWSINWLPSESGRCEYLPPYLFHKKYYWDCYVE